MPTCQLKGQPAGTTCREWEPLPSPPGVADVEMVIGEHDEGIVEEEVFRSMSDDKRSAEGALESLVEILGEP